MNSDYEPMIIEAESPNTPFIERNDQDLKDTFGQPYKSATYISASRKGTLKTIGKGSAPMSQPSVAQVSLN